MGAVELLRVVLAAVFPYDVSRGAVAIVDLQEVIVTVGAALQVEEREGDTHDLKTRRSKVIF